MKHYDIAQKSDAQLANDIEKLRTRLKGGGIVLRNVAPSMQYRLSELMKERRTRSLTAYSSLAQFI